jgi:predicted SAM-dependent methyltransferase
VGIDLNGTAIKAGKGLGLDLRAMDFEAVDIEMGNFDAITALHVLEHAGSPKAFLQRCNDLLKTGGVLSVEVPDFACRDSSQKREFWPPLQPDLHLYQFTKDTLIRYLVGGGFEIVKVNKTHGRGPLENRTPGLNGNTARSRIKDIFFECRHLVYWIPKVKDIARHLIWETLGYGQFLRVIARKNRYPDGGQ